MTSSTRTAPPPLFVVFNIGSGHGDAAAARAVIVQACDAAGRAVQWLVVDDPKRIGKAAGDTERVLRFNLVTRPKWIL